MIRFALALLTLLIVAFLVPTQVAAENTQDTPTSADSVAAAVTNTPTVLGGTVCSLAVCESSTVCSQQLKNTVTIIAAPARRTITFFRTRRPARRLLFGTVTVVPRGRLAVNLGKRVLTPVANTIGFLRSKKPARRLVFGRRLGLLRGGGCG